MQPGKKHYHTDGAFDLLYAPRYISETPDSVDFESKAHSVGYYLWEYLEGLSDDVKLLETLTKAYKNIYEKL